MKNSIFYGFRGSIVFPDQTSIYDVGYENNSISKNKIFRKCIKVVEENKKLKSKYLKRAYYLIYKNKYGDIVHCQLARKKSIKKRTLENDTIVEELDEDYPYVNVIIELKSQKFLIEYDSQVYENYDTCSKVIRNIINYNLNPKSIEFELNPITREQDFWKYFSNNSKIYSIEFRLIYPNIFDSEDEAENLIKDVNEKTGGTQLSISVSNGHHQKLTLKKEGIDSFVRYASKGGGYWKMKYTDSNNKSKTVDSHQTSNKINIPISYDDFRNSSLSSDQIDILIANFNKIEAEEKLKV